MYVLSLKYTFHVMEDTSFLFYPRVEFTNCVFAVRRQEDTDYFFKKKERKVQTLFLHEIKR